MLRPTPDDVLSDLAPLLEQRRFRLTDRIDRDLRFEGPDFCLRLNGRTGPWVATIETPSCGPFLLGGVVAIAERLELPGPSDVAAVKVALGDGYEVLAALVRERPRFVTLKVQRSPW